MFRSKLGRLVVIFTILCCIDWVIVKMRGKCRGHGSLLEAGGIGCRLTSELSKIKIRASFVTQIHGFGESALGVEAVKDNGVNADGENFDDDLDESAKQRPVLQVWISIETFLINS